MLAWWELATHPLSLTARARMIPKGTSGLFPPIPQLQMVIQRTAAKKTGCPQKNADFVVAGAASLAGGMDYTLPAPS